MSPNRRIDPRIRALGKARIDVTRRARDEQEWQRLWREPRFPFAFEWGPGAKHCIQYVVEDFAAEVGFYIDVLGFPVSAFSPNYAQFTTPDQEVHFGVVAAPEGQPGTPPETLRIQFSILHLAATIRELENRGIQFEVRPEEDQNALAYAVLRSPHGVGIELLGMVEPEAARPVQTRHPAPRPQPAPEPALPQAPPPRVEQPALPRPEPVPSLQDSLAAFWEDHLAETGETTGIAEPDSPAGEQPDRVVNGSRVEDEMDAEPVTYEDIEDPLDEIDEPTYEDINEDDADVDVPAAPLPAPVVKPRPRPAVPPARPAATVRNLEVTLPPTRLNRSRRKPPSGGSQPFRNRDDRDPRH